MALILLGLLALCVQSSGAQIRAACAADYSSCGSSLPSPIGNLPCCNASFYCYTHGPYFSQCRPIQETNPTEQTRALHKSLCARDFGVCSAGSSADTHLKCCNPDFVCVPASPLFWQCVPGKSRWYEVHVRGVKMRSFMDSSAAARVNARLLQDSEKVVRRTKTTGRGLNVFVPVMNRAERDVFESMVRSFNGVRDVDRGVGIVFVQVDRGLEDVARKVAAMRQVASVEFV